MEIMWLKLKGYRRFKDEVTLNLSGKLIALLGSNEAGKTSILKAFDSLNSDNPIDKDDIFKSTEDFSGETYIKAQFLLSEDEIKEAKIEAGSKLEVCKKSSSNGLREFEILPRPPKRDLSLRKKTHGLMKKALANKDFVEAINGAENNGLRHLQSLMSLIASEEEDLAPQPLSQHATRSIKLFSLANLEPVTKEIKSIGNKIQKLLDFEQKPSSNEFAKQTLKSKLPHFLLFSDDDRKLQYQYSVTEIDSPTKSLTTLAKLANLDLKSLSTKITNKESGRLRGLLASANTNLQTVFDGKWSQSRLQIELAVINNNSLEILLSEGHKVYTELKLRSDGFRQFLALVSLASSLAEENVVLLVDEIELHLHYDGQADLLQTLAKQGFAKKIIYSTHSIGCLPEDLGGIKIVERDGGGFTSKIDNKFWTGEKSGFSPLLPRIGAQQLAFLPLRNAVVAEGPMDMLLLPQIFKETIGQDHVGFLIAHGLSEKSLNQISGFDGNGLKVAYLTDCDRGGQKINDQLIKRGVDKSRIFSLPGEIGKDTITLEELLTAEVLVNAFNAYLDRYHLGKERIGKSDLPLGKKVASLKAAAKKRGLELSDVKVPLAYEVLSLIAEDPTMKIVEAKHRKGIKSLHAKILKVMSK